MLRKNISRKIRTGIKIRRKVIHTRRKTCRVYPNRELFSHIIGQIDDNNNGISGLEKSFDYELTSSKETLKLTVDKELQYLIRKELIKSQNIFQNVGSAAILMNIHNGEILSMISLPDFDLNQRKNLNDLNILIGQPKVFMNLVQFLRHLL